jgi:hypothetical protein
MMAAILSSGLIGLAFFVPAYFDGRTLTAASTAGGASATAAAAAASVGSASFDPPPFVIGASSEKGTNVVATAAGRPDARHQRDAVATEPPENPFVPVGDGEELAFSVEAKMRERVFESDPIAPSFTHAGIAPFVDHPHVPGGARRPITAFPSAVTSAATQPAVATINTTNPTLECDPSEHSVEGVQHREQLRKRWETYKTLQKTADPQQYCIALCAMRNSAKNEWDVEKNRAGRQLVRSAYSWIPQEGLECCPDALRTLNDMHILSAGDAVVDDGTSEVTYVTQGTSNRISALTATLAMWPGPVVAVFAVANYSADLHAGADDQFRDLREACARWARPNLRVIAFVLDHTYGNDYISLRMRTGSKLGLYPVNAIRNLALDEAQSNWVFPADMDFIPGKTLYPNLKQVHLQRMSQINRPAIVIPHFEIPDCPNEEPLPIPENFEELRTMLIAELATAFHVKATRVLPLNKIPNYPRRTLFFNHTGTIDGPRHHFQTNDCKQPTTRSWAWGILATNYRRWFEESHYSAGMFRISVPWAPKDPANVAKLPKEFRGTPCPVDPKTGRLVARAPDAPECGRVKFVSGESWEPFVLFRKVEATSDVEAPRYGEGYIGRYKNKVEFVTKLRALRYKFYTLQREFIVHIPHAVGRATSHDQQIMKDLMIEHHEREALKLTQRLQDFPDPPISRFEHGFQCGFDEVAMERPLSRLTYWDKSGKESTANHPSHPFAGADGQ